MVRKTLQWIAAILALGGAGGGGYAYWLYTQTDEWLRAYAQKAFLQRIPTAVISIGRARFDWSHRIHLYDVRLSAQGLDEPVARCVEIIVTVDGQELSENQQIDVRSLRILHPDVRLLRDAAGTWNWQKLKLARPEDPCPELSFEDLQVGVWLARNGKPSSSFHVQQSSVRLIPSAHREFSVEAVAQLPGLGDVQCSGSFSPDKGIWKVRGGTKGAADITELVDSVEHIFPESAQQLADLQTRLQTDPLKTADLSPAKPSAPTSVSGQAKIDFEIGRDKPNTELDYRAAAVLELNDINHPLLPFPLQNLTGRVYVDKHQLILKDITVRNGPTQLTADGRIDLPEPSSENRINIKIQDLALDSRLGACLPERGRQFFATVHPAGHLDANGAIVRNASGKWEMDGWALVFKHCTASHEKFPFPITEIDGTAVQKGNSLLLSFRGWAGERPATLVGSVRNLGPEAEGEYLVKVQRLPIDHALLTAAKAQPGFYRTLTNLNVHGQVDACCHFHRPPGPERKVEWWLDAHLNNGSIQFVSFPYLITDLSGHFAFDSLQEKWTFEDLQGTHGPGRLYGTGLFVKPAPQDPGELKLEIHAENIPLEAELQRACPENTQKLWALVGPMGNLRTQIKLDWIPGTKPEIVIPDATVTDATIEAKSFPFSLDHITAKFMFGREPRTNKDKLTIVSFEGHHDETIIWTDKRSVSFVLCPPGDDPIGEWRLRLGQLHVRDLTPDRTLRRALPAGLRNTVKALDPLGKIDLEGTLELRGTRDERDPITAYWNYRTAMTDATILTGVKLEHVFGTVESEGTWDGTQVHMHGKVDLLSLQVLNHQFANVKGPFKLDNQDLIVGSERAFPAANGAHQQPIPNDERLTARAVGGVFLLDAKAHLDSQRTTYFVKTAMHNANLDQYARDYGLGSNLHGVMNGWAELSGDSADPKDVTGGGQLVIHPAALYELPVFIQLFKAFSFAAPDKTAFNYALTTFDIRNRVVNFRDIDLIGDAISLRGRGWARFDGPLNLQFYSRPANAWSQVPGLSSLFDQFTQGWVGVSVVGTVQRPIARVMAMPQIDSAFRNFLAAINRPGSTPALTPPPWMLAPRAASASP
jgi:AsmA-like C-terminal region